MRLGSAYLMMLHSGSIRTMVGSSLYSKNRSRWILALSTCTITFIFSSAASAAAAAAAQDVVLQTM